MYYYGSSSLLSLSNKKSLVDNGSQLRNRETVGGPMRSVIPKKKKKKKRREN